MDSKVSKYSRQKTHSLYLLYSQSVSSFLYYSFSPSLASFLPYLPRFQIILHLKRLFHLLCLITNWFSSLFHIHLIARFIFHIISHSLEILITFFIIFTHLFSILWWFPLIHFILMKTHDLFFVYTSFEEGS